MKVTAHKISPGRYGVMVDGRQTTLLIERGDAPKYRQPRTWHVGRRRPEIGDVFWYSFDHRGLADALTMVREIAESCAAVRSQAAICL